MSRTSGVTTSPTPLARVTVGSRGRAYSMVWAVPVAAALVAGYLVYERVQEIGPSITIKFKDGSGLRTGLTPLKYRGVSIGEVVAIGLSGDHQYVLATVRLRRSLASMAVGGTTFWIVRPEVGLGNITGLSTVITGPEIQMQPGAGPPRSEFVGLESAPSGPDHKGLGITLHCARLGSIKAQTPIFYRGLEVGAVQTARLSRDATGVDVQGVIQQRYAPLVRSDSKFWKMSGAGISGGLFRGLEFRLDSLSTLVTGGIEFATPENSDPAPARTRTGFLLYDEPQKEWLKWAPRIPIRTEQ
ncbi:MAG TPA: MlaD family protein [Steroidobacteraceae bacterium]|nr:MlaD family protein [Steroidobacteraceae bacterium]